jgi:ABC-2 type transport system ATP-binding protein
VSGAADAMIEVAGLRREFAGAVALDGVSFQVGRGEVVGLLGPNGAGKTTCIRVLTGLLPPTAGRVRIAGLDHLSESLATRRQIGYLPEGAPGYPELRVEEQLRFRAAVRGLRRRARGLELDRVCSLAGLGEEVRHRLVGQLSKGYRQRLALAEALLGDPPLLVLDEPTVGLDPNQIRETRELVRGLGGGHTVLLSTHILPEVAAICTRVLILHRGRLVADQTLESLATDGTDLESLFVKLTSDDPAGEPCAA